MLLLGASTPLKRFLRGGGSHNSFSQMTVCPRRADLVREWQAAMDPEKLTRVFVCNEGFHRRYALGFCQALPLNGDLSTHSHLDRSTRLPGVSTLSIHDLVLPKHTRSSIAPPPRSRSLIDTVAGSLCASHATISTRFTVTIHLD